RTRLPSQSPDLNQKSRTRRSGLLCLADAIPVLYPRRHIGDRAGSAVMGIFHKHRVGRLSV
ncbi:MAG: hypothetical protein V4661_15810, partial [Pseudomonadota bacterium]